MPINQEKLQKITKKSGWLFDWKFEYNQAKRHVYKLVTTENTQTIHGLVSFEERVKHIYMHRIESSPFNRGKGKKYLGIAGNLVAYVCKSSMECGGDGVISFHAKTALIDERSEPATVLARAWVSE